MRAVASPERTGDAGAAAPAGAPPVVLPPWACVSDRRRAHIERVCALLDAWAVAMRLDAEERRAWADAGRLHDALRDASEPELRALSGDAESQVELLHGPAAAARLEAEGERRAGVLDAVRWHTLGSASWERVGRALYMADYLEPGRTFARSERAFLASVVPHDFERAFREVLRHRLEWALRDGKALRPETVALWNRVR